MSRNRVTFAPMPILQADCKLKMGYFVVQWNYIKLVFVLFIQGV